jgi:prolyl-tRNA synthetase
LILEIGLQKVSFAVYKLIQSNIGKICAKVFMANKLTSRDQDYSKWYNEIVVQADLAENSAVRGCMVIKPYGYAIWEKMQAELDKMFKATGTKMPTSLCLFPRVCSRLKKKMRKVLQKNVL